MKNKPNHPDTCEKNSKNSWKMSNFSLITLTALFIVAFDNFAFYKNVTDIYPVSISNILFLISLTVVLTSVLILLGSIFCFKYTTKPILITVLLVSSVVSYFMNNYSIVIDETMLQNILETDSGEVTDLLHLKLFIYIGLAGILPSLIIYKIKITYKSFPRELLSRVIRVVAAIAVILVSALPVSNFYSGFLREHKPLRYYTNPTYFLFSIGKYISRGLKNSDTEMTVIGSDAKIPETDTDRELIILVVGEAARADRFSLGGYERETNPMLANEDLTFFPNMYSCGTSTSVSVPCMFSIYPREDYSDSRAKSTHNVLDVLKNAGVHILWRDNNSDSKGVATRVEYQDFKLPENNPVCDIECRDVGMISGLQEYIDSHTEGDILIVLHQMGNHGPAYYKRYPQEFKKFIPVCESNQFEECTKDEIGNAYDNAILYTDYFLSKVIDLLIQNSQFEAAMFYISDHGESLGENNIYLHGMPYFMAPETQKHIPAIMWFGEGYHINKDALDRVSSKPYSQDNIFHTLLGLMEIETSVYNKNMDILHSGEENIIEEDEEE